MDADPFGEGVRTVGGEAGEGFDAGERLFFPVSGSKVNTGFAEEIFIPQLFRCQVLVISSPATNRLRSLELKNGDATAAFGRGTRGPARPGMGGSGGFGRRVTGGFGRGALSSR